MSLRILVTGSRLWVDRGVIDLALWRAAREFTAESVTVVHGAARGADSIADSVARVRGFNVERHPAQWRRHGRASGPRRNAEMVALGADICLAFPLGESPGTRGCMKLAEAAGIRVENWGAP